MPFFCTNSPGAPLLQPVCYLLPPEHLLGDPPGAMLALLQNTRRHDVPCADIGRALVAAWELAAPYADAIHAAAAAADQSGRENAYHNPAHTRDVALCWANLATLNDHLAQTGSAPLALTAVARAAGLLAAFGHDLLHDGVGNLAAASSSGAAPVWSAFRLESIAARHMETLLCAHGVAPATISIVTAAILATDPRDGYAALGQALNDGGAGPFAHPGLASLASAECRLVATLLRDADLLNSAGLSAAEHDRQSCLLAAEQGGGPPDAKASERFFRDIVQGRFLSPPGVLFGPRLRALAAEKALLF